MTRYKLHRAIFTSRYARLVCAGLLALSSVFTADVYAAALRITLVLSEAKGAYQEYRNVIEPRLLGKGYNVSVVEADKPIPDAELVIAAGMKATVAVIQAKPAAMLAVLVPKSGVTKLQHDFSAQLKAGHNMFSAIYLDQPYQRQLDLISAVLPQAHSVGVLYSELPRDINILRSLLATRKMELNERASVTSAAIYSSLQTLLLSSDVLLALPDAEIYNTVTIRNILLSTYRSKVPLVGFSAAYVRAGALCAVFSTAEQIADQSLNIAQEFVATSILPPTQYPIEFEVSVNEQVARSLGISIKSTAQIRSEMGVDP